MKHDNMQPGPIVESSEIHETLPALVDAAEARDGQPLAFANDTPDPRSLPAESEWFDHDAAVELYEELTELLDDLAPPFQRFHVDGEWHGFVPDMEAIREDAAILKDSRQGGVELDGERIPNGNDWEPVAEYRLFVEGNERFYYVAYVNDHGNLPLYRWESPDVYRLIWDAV